VTYGLIS